MRAKRTQVIEAEDMLHLMIQACHLTPCDGCSMDGWYGCAVYGSDIPLDNALKALGFELIDEDGK